MNKVHKLVVFKLLELIADRRFRIRVILPTYVPYENNLHHIMQDFLKGGEDYWLNIDADNPPIENPLDLIELDKDIIGMPTPVWHLSKEMLGNCPLYWNAFDYVPEEDMYQEHFPRNGLVKVDAVGTGCILVARRVIENKVIQSQGFHRKWKDKEGEDGTVWRGNDIAFCERARELGFEVWTHYDYPCHHVHEVEFTLMNKAYRHFHKYLDKVKEEENKHVLDKENKGN